MPKKCSRKAVFLDRDGVINDLICRGEDFFVCGKKIAYTAPFTFEELKIKPNVKEALAILREAGFLLIVVTNQPDVAYGLQSRVEYEKIMAEIEKLGFDDIFVCPHRRTENCSCKKPKIGLFLAAQKKWNIDFKNSYMIGDFRTDMEAGRDIRAFTILVSAEYNYGTACDFLVNNLLEAAELIIQLNQEEEEAE